MDIIERIREEQELDRLLFQEGRNKMNFKRIGKRIVNLDTVTTVKYSPDGGYSHRSPCVTVSFIGETDNYISIYKGDEPVAFAQLMAWMGAQPALLPVIDVEPEGEDEAGTHPPDCSCPWCSSEE